MGLALGGYGLARLIDGPPPVQLGGGLDFEAGPLHEGGAATQWFRTRTDTIRAVAFRPGRSSSPSDLTIVARLIDSRQRILAEATGSLEDTDAEGWLRIELPAVPLIVDAEYGAQLSVASGDRGFLHIEASSFQPMGLGLEINQIRDPGLSARLQIYGPTGLGASARLLASAAAEMPAAAIAAGLAVVIAIAGAVVWIRRISRGLGRPARVLGNATATIASVGIALAAAGWALG